MRLSFGIEMSPAQPIPATPIRATPPPGYGYPRMFFFKWCKNFPAHRSRIYAPRPSFKGARFRHVRRGASARSCRSAFRGSNYANMAAQLIPSPASHRIAPRSVPAGSEKSRERYFVRPIDWRLVHVEKLRLSGCKKPIAQNHRPFRETSSPVPGVLLTSSAFRLHRIGAPLGFAAISHVWHSHSTQFPRERTTENRRRTLHRR